MKKEIASHLLITAFWLAAVTLLRIANHPFLGWIYYLEFVGFWMGGILGTMLLDIDHLIYILAVRPNESTSLKIKDLIIQKDYRGALKLLGETYGERTHLTFHNALFQIAFFGLCFWVLTSTDSLFGKGLVMATALHLLKDELEFLLKGKEEQLRLWLFWPLGVVISLENQRYFIVIMLLAFIIFSLLLI